jgi:hypothetical protein
MRQIMIRDHVTNLLNFGAILRSLVFVRHVGRSNVVVGGLQTIMGAFLAVNVSVDFSDSKNKQMWTGECRW